MCGLPQHDMTEESRTVAEHVFVHLMITPYCWQLQLAASLKCLLKWFQLGDEEQLYKGIPVKAF